MTYPPLPERIGLVRAKQMQAYADAHAAQFAEDAARYRELRDHCEWLSINNGPSTDLAIKVPVALHPIVGHKPGHLDALIDAARGAAK